MGHTKELETHLVEMEPYEKSRLYTPRLMYVWILCVTVVVVLLAAMVSLLAYQNKQLNRRVDFLELRLKKVDVVLDFLQTAENEEAIADVVISRRKRELPTEAHVVEGSYIDNASTPSEGLRLYERWQVSGGQNEPLSQEITIEETLGRHNYTATTNASTRRKGLTKLQRVSSRNRVPVIERRSRVKQTGSTTSAPIIIHPKSWEVLTDYEGVTLPPEITHLPSNTTRRRRRRKHRRPHKKQLRSRHEEDNFIEDSLTELDVRGRGSPPPTAALYHADGDRARGRSEHYGNYRVSNSNRKFMHLRHSDWMDRLGLNQNYKLRNGDIVITRPGLYYIFAQVQYSDMRDLNGFQIDVNEQPVTNCVTMTTTEPGNMIKSNTCFTATLAYLTGRDRVGLRDLDHHRISLQKEGHTYVGLVWLMDG